MASADRKQGAADSHRIKFVTHVSEPPELTPEMLAQIAEESQREYAAFMKQTASMEVLTAADLRIRIK